MGFNIAIDGPAGAGKSTIAKLVAARQNCIYVDTGAMYRGLAVHFLGKQIDPSDINAVIDACRDADVSIRYEDGMQQVYLNGTNITGQLRREEVGDMASKTSAIPEVRAKLLELQRTMAREHDVVMDGRDIGTNILPDADVKIYLTASVETRAKRRFDELQAKGQECDRSETERKMYCQNVICFALRKRNIIRGSFGLVCLRHFKVLHTVRFPWYSPVWWQILARRRWLSRG